MRRFVVALFIAVIATVTIGTGNAQAALIFHSGFETGNFTEWTAVVGAPSIELVVGIREESQGALFAGTNLWGSTWLAQTFTTGSAYTIQIVALQMMYSGSPGTITVGIRATDGSSHPTGSDLASGTVNLGDLEPGIARWTVIDLGVGASLSAGTKYAIVVRAPDGGGSDTGTMFWDNTNPYSGGAYESSSNSGVDWTTTSAKDFNFVVGTAFPKTGDYALRLTTEAATAYVEYFSASSVRCFTSYIYLAEYPSVLTTILGHPVYGNVRIDSDGYLWIYYGDSSGEASANPLPLNTWIRVSGSVNEAKSASVWINGSEKLSDVFINALWGGASETWGFRVGISHSSNFDIYFDDIVCSGTYSTEDLGDIRVELSQPNAEGFRIEYDNPVPSAIHYENVDNVPQDANVDDDYNEIEATGLFWDIYNIEDSSAIGLGGSDTIVAISNWSRMKRNGGGGTTHGIIVVDDGTSDSELISLTTSFIWYNRYDAVMPKDSGEWTQARFDALEVGVARSGAQDQHISNVQVMVAYIPTVDGADISNTPSNKAFGIIAPNTTSSTTINYFTITNNSGAAVSITIQGTDFTGGDDTWDLSDTATPGENIYGLKAGLDDDDDLFDVIVKETEAYNTLVSGLADSGTQDWGLKLYMPTSVTNYDGQQMSAIVTLVASLD